MPFISNNIIIVREDMDQYFCRVKIKSSKTSFQPQPLNLKVKKKKVESYYLIL